MKTKQEIHRLLRMKSDQKEMYNHFEDLELRRNLITLIEYIRDNKVVGTQKVGNMPLKAVKAIASNFVHPLELEAKIGNYTYRVRSESDLWGLHIIRIFAEVGGLVSVGPSRRWRLLDRGVEFLNFKPFLQVFYMFSVWWYEINWLVAYPYAGMGDALPNNFKNITFSHLYTLPVGKKIELDNFADKLIKETGLTWTAQDTSMAHSLLRGSIGHMVIEMLNNFGIVKVEYRKKDNISYLDTFEITQAGRLLLEMLNS